MTAARATSATATNSANGALIVLEHERSADVICEGRHLCVAKHLLEQGEDALTCGRVGRQGAGPPDATA